MDNTFNWKITLFRMLTVGYTLFLASFCKQYNLSHDVTVAFHSGLDGLITGVAGGFGLDQIIFHYLKNTNSMPTTPTT